MREQNTDNSGNLLYYLKILTFSCMISALMVCILFTAAHFIMMGANLPLRAAEPIIILVNVISAFAGGFSAAKLARKNGLILGFSSGLLIFILLLISNLSYGNRLGILALIKFFLITASSSLGGIIAVNKGKNKKCVKHKVQVKRKR